MVHREGAEGDLRFMRRRSSGFKEKGYRSWGCSEVVGTFHRSQPVLAPESIQQVLGTPTAHAPCGATW
jgi:hypothetical protein